MLGAGMGSPRAPKPPGFSAKKKKKRGKFRNAMDRLAGKKPNQQTVTQEEYANFEMYAEDSSAVEGLLSDDELIQGHVIVQGGRKHGRHPTGKRSYNLPRRRGGPSPKRGNAVTRPDSGLNTWSPRSPDSNTREFEWPSSPVGGGDSVPEPKARKSKKRKKTPRKKASGNFEPRRKVSSDFGSGVRRPSLTDGSRPIAGDTKVRRDSFRRGKARRKERERGDSAEKETGKARRKERERGDSAEKEMTGAVRRDSFGRGKAKRKGSAEKETTGAVRSYASGANPKEGTPPPDNKKAWKDAKKRSKRAPRQNTMASIGQGKPVLLSEGKRSRRGSGGTSRKSPATREPSWNDGPARAGEDRPRKRQERGPSWAEEITRKTSWVDDQLARKASAQDVAHRKANWNDAPAAAKLRVGRAGNAPARKGSWDDDPSLRKGSWNGSQSSTGPQPRQKDANVFWGPGSPRPGGPGGPPRNEPAEPHPKNSYRDRTGSGSKARSKGSLRPIDEKRKAKNKHLKAPPQMPLMPKKRTAPVRKNSWNAGPVLAPGRKGSWTGVRKGSWVDEAATAQAMKQSRKGSYVVDEGASAAAEKSHSEAIFLESSLQSGVRPRGPDKRHGSVRITNSRLVGQASSHSLSNKPPPAGGGLAVPQDDAPRQKSQLLQESDLLGELRRAGGGGDGPHGQHDADGANGLFTFQDNLSDVFEDLGLSDGEKVVSPKAAPEPSSSSMPANAPGGQKFMSLQEIEEFASDVARTDDAFQRQFEDREHLSDLSDSDDPSCMEVEPSRTRVLDPLGRSSEQREESPAYIGHKMARGATPEPTVFEPAAQLPSRNDFEKSGFSQPRKAGPQARNQKKKHKGGPRTKTVIQKPAGPVNANRKNVQQFNDFGLPDGGKATDEPYNWPASPRGAMGGTPWNQGFGATANPRPVAPNPRGEPTTPQNRSTLPAAKQKQKNLPKSQIGNALQLPDSWLDDLPAADPSLPANSNAALDDLFAADNAWMAQSSNQTAQPLDKFGLPSDPWSQPSDTSAVEPTPDRRKKSFFSTVTRDEGRGGGGVADPFQNFNFNQYQPGLEEEEAFAMPQAFQNNKYTRRALKSSQPAYQDNHFQRWPQEGGPPGPLSPNTTGGGEPEHFFVDEWPPEGNPSTTGGQYNPFASRKNSRTGNSRSNTTNKPVVVEPDRGGNHFQTKALRLDVLASSPLTSPTGTGKTNANAIRHYMASGHPNQKVNRGPPKPRKASNHRAGPAPRLHAFGKVQQANEPNVSTPNEPYVSTPGARKAVEEMTNFEGGLGNSLWQQSPHENDLPEQESKNEWVARAQRPQKQMYFGDDFGATPAY